MERVNSEKSNYDLELWDGQLHWYTNDTEFLPPKISFGYTVRENNSVEHNLYLVKGEIWDDEFNTGFKFGKAFYELDKAELFFEKFKERYPNSKITIEHEYKITLKSYD